METIPTSLIACIASEMAQMSHSNIDHCFEKAGFPGDIPQANKLDKCKVWLRRLNNPETASPLDLLGGLLQQFMENEPVDRFSNPTRAINSLMWSSKGISPPVCPPSPWQERKAKFEEMLEKHQLRYVTGGRILEFDAMPSPVRTLDEMLRSRDLRAVDVEFERALANVTSDPPAALTAACAIIEASCKVYIQESSGRIAIPRDQSIKPLWMAVQADLGLDPKDTVEEDVRRLLGGLSSIVDNVGAFRTHAGSAHGRGQGTFKVEPRHARLAVNSAHTLVVFLLETWELGRR